ncbi:ceramidase [Rhodovulum tesquicola]|uniref:ceramidase domain-containing protein n=1 Tax=Rhodovulum tesquicola TaxID=540254 RepID=UPI002097770D|nr:ceramidase domain-containing protein [Rhodovulum tesquicola]MCO8144534.1 ceramidase [Rhodovulum tesquicola]
MDWMAQVDAYCERTDLGYWSEPVNAVTNAAFLVAAAVMWRRTGGLALGRALCVVLAVIGVGSFLFHTHATLWAAMADVLPILGFILLYLFAAHRDFWGLGPWPALGLTALFLPYAAGTGWLFGQLGFLGSSAGYAPVALLILSHAGLLARRAPATARGLALGGGLLVVSLTFRTLDEPLCAVLPLGTHFLWHVLNAVMLGWMIEVYRRHMGATH